jgi:Helix-turn-helix domain
MPRDPHMVYIPISLLDDRRLSARDLATLMLLIALADNSPRCDYDEHTLAHRLGVTTRTVRKWLARLEGFGYLLNHKDWVELHDDLVLTQDSLLMADLPPLSDEEFTRLQEADDPDEFLKDYAGRKLFVDLPRALIEGHPRPKRP